MEQANNYQQHYSDERFWDKMKKFGKSAGMKVSYVGLLLFYALKSPKTPLKAKVQIYGALGYLVFPLDALPDFLPAMGYVDDLGALMLAFGHVASNIDADARQKAKDKVKEIFGGSANNHRDIIEVDAKLGGEQRV